MCPRDAHLHHRFLHDARTRIAVAPLECDRSVTTTSTCDSRRGPRLNIAEEPPLVSKATWRMREGISAAAVRQESSLVHSVRPPI